MADSKDKVVRWQPGDYTGPEGWEAWAEDALRYCEYEEGRGTLDLEGRTDDQLRREYALNDRMSGINRSHMEDIRKEQNRRSAVARGVDGNGGE